MLMIISPAKKLDYDTTPVVEKHTQPEFLHDSQLLIDELKNYTPQEIGQLMNLSANLAQLNYERFQMWHQPFTPSNAKQALLAFKGDVYRGMKPEQFSTDDFNEAQKRLRILSGLYGLLRPLDLMQPYRLEMGTKIPNPRGKNLYEFWGSRITEKLNEIIDLQNYNVLVNLASGEYYKAVNEKKLRTPVITPDFREERNGKYKTIGIHAKKARGMMTRFIIQHQIYDPEELKSFTAGGYGYSEELSSGNKMVFIR